MIEAHFSAEKRHDLEYLITAMADGIEAGVDNDKSEPVVGFETTLANADDK